MQYDLIWELMKKDWAEIFRSKQIYIFVIFFPALLVLGMPVLLVFIVSLSPQLMLLNPGTAAIIAFLPPVVPEPTWSQLEAGTKLILSIATISQLFILIVPIMVPNMISSDSIVGEKERKTVEALLSLPLSDEELLAAKIMSSVLPGLVATLLFVIPHVILIDLLVYPYLGALFLPDLRFMLYLGLLTPLAALASVLFTVMISARVSTIRDAQQLTGFLILPLLLLVVGQLFLLMLHPLLILIGAAVLVFVDFVLFRISLRVFNRERLVVSQ